MRILYSIHLYPPIHNCGGEAYIHNLNKYLIKQGHEVRVMLQRPEQFHYRVPYDWEGVYVMGLRDNLDAYRWADVLVTHLDFTHWTLTLGHDVGRPVVQIVHNHHEYASIINAKNPPFIVYNSEWISKTLNYKYPSIVVPPAVDYDRYNVCDDPEKNEFITLINLNTNKGGRILQKLAKVFPDKRFLAVKGSYDKQITEQPENVFVIDNTPDILPIYKQTRLLIMPSQYESWGMTATEAMCSGIPVICTPTPGLKENCDYAGNYIDLRKGDLFDDNGNVLDDTDQYDITSLVNMIKKFDDKSFYKERSNVSRIRAKEHDPLEYCKRFENFLYETQSVKLKNYV